MEKMKPDVKAKWIAALRSGEYQQTTHCLRIPDSKSMCCLGVLADVVDPDGWERADTSENWHPHRGQDQLPAKSVCELAGLPSPFLYGAGEVLDPDKPAPIVNRLAELNDDGKSFEEIAAFIEENL